MDDELLLRYSRQIMLPQIDIAGQQALLDAHVLIVGLGGLGSPVSMYLAAAGVGHLVLCDFDRVDESNLQRQIVHEAETVGEPKVLSAKRRLSALNPTIKIDTVDGKLVGDALLAQVREVNLVVDCTDNLETRLHLNQACFTAKKPMIYGAAIRMEGQISVFDPNDVESPCYRCLHPTDTEIDQTCTTNGVLAPVVGVIGSLQALEAIKWITKAGENPVGRLWLFDALHLEWCEMALPKRAGCPVCG